MLLRRVLHGLVLAAGYVVGLLVANRPRFWWQELFHSAALFWIAPALAAALWLAVRMYAERRWSWFAALACLAYVSAAASMVTRVLPYIAPQREHGSTDVTRSSLSAVWIDSWTQRDNPEWIREITDRARPTVLVVSGEAVAELASAPSVKQYPYRIELLADQSSSILVLSKIPSGEDATLNLGLNAWAGGFIPLKVGEAKHVMFGVVDLVYSGDRESFERNRISARRLSTLIRNSSDTRIVAAQLQVTPFSQIAATFTQQSHVYSLRAGLGMLAGLRVLTFCRTGCPAQVFASKDVRFEQFEELAFPGRAQPAVYFKVAIPTG